MKRILPALFLCAACGAGLVDHGGVDLQSTLQCAARQQPCGSVCVSTDLDANNCGGCGIVCATPSLATSTCTARTCGFSCKPGFFPCASQAACCPASALAAGGDTSCAVVEGSVQCWGSNGSGQLGTDPAGAGWSAKPVAVPGLAPSSSVAVGLSHACAILAGTGEVVCWGSNFFLQLGAAGTGRVKVPGIAGAQLLALGDRHSCAVTASGVSCWGANEFGQLGQGSSTPSAAPGPVTGLAAASSISAGSAFTCAVVSGTAYCWGSNSIGQLAEGTYSSSPTPVPVGNVSNALSVGAGAEHACAIGAGSKFWCWGSNSSGQIGNGSPPSSSAVFSGVSLAATTVAGGREHTCGVAGGQAFCWGSNVFGQLGIGLPSGLQTRPTQVSGLASGVQRLALGAAHSCAQTPDGAVYCWGNNSSGQAGAPVGGTLLAPRPID